MGANCSLPFCLEDWGLLGFGLFTAVAALVFVLVVHALFVRCSYCADNYAHLGFRYALKRRSHAEFARQYLGEREFLIQERRQSNSSWRHWDSDGRFAGTSESTTTWHEWVPRRVSVYERLYECPDCGNQWSQTW